MSFAFPTQTILLAGDVKRQLAVKMLGDDLSTMSSSAANNVSSTQESERGPSE